MKRLINFLCNYKKELKIQLRLFFPLLLGQVCVSGMSVADTIMAGMASTIDLSGVALGCAFYWPCVLFLVGLVYAITPIVSHLLPSKNYGLIKQNLFNATIISLIIGVLVGVFLALLPLIYNFIDADIEMVNVAKGYIYAVSLAMPFCVLYNILRSYADGLGFTKPTMYFGILMLLLDIPLNYIFIFGHLGMPKLGGVGCGVSTALIIVISSILMLIIIIKGNFFKAFKTNQNVFTFDKTLIKNFLKLAVPLGLSRTVEVACFSLGAVIISPFGPMVVAAHSITLNISSLIFMIPLSLAITMTIRTAYNLGLGSFARVWVSIKSGLRINLVIYFIYASLVFIYRDNLASFYSDDSEVLKLCSTLIIFNCIYMLPDSIQAFLLGTLQGFKDSKVTLYIIMFSYLVVGIPCCYVLAWGTFGEPLKASGIWIGFIICLLTAAICYAFRTRYLLKHKIMLLSNEKFD